MVPYALREMCLFWILYLKLRCETVGWEHVEYSTCPIVFVLATFCFILHVFSVTNHSNVIGGFLYKVNYNKSQNLFVAKFLLLFMWLWHRKVMTIFSIPPINILLTLMFFQLTKQLLMSTMLDLFQSLKIYPVMDWHALFLIKPSAFHSSD